MPILNNPRWERFAQELAQGKSASEAYQLAGYRANDGNAIRLKGNECVSGRVSELLERAGERAEITVAGSIKKAERVYDAAHEAKQFSAAMTAVKEIGVLSANRVERGEAGKPGEFADLEAMSAAELRALIRSQLEDDDHDLV
jgi:phage terminase small subunit